MKLLTIQDRTVPALGFGTYPLRDDDCVEAVIDAVALGYRHIDSAKVYENEAAVGQGIRECGLGREDIFLTTKIGPDAADHDAFLAEAEDSLAKLNIDYIDLLLLHWPNRDVPIERTMAAACKLVDECKVQHIGVSNFTPALVAEAAKHAPIFCNQVEHHPFLSQQALVAQAVELGYMLTAYCPIARNRVADTPDICAIAKAHGKSPAQVSLRWLMQKPNVAAIPKASSNKHRRANIDVFDFELSENEMAQIDALNENHRICIATKWAPAEWGV